MLTALTPELESTIHKFAAGGFAMSLTAEEVRAISYLLIELQGLMSGEPEKPARKAPDETI